MDSLNSDPEYDAFKEIRFAVVIYGGVSLAIYINGVVQEMLRLVRATAPHPSQPKKLHVETAVGSEKVYRKLGCLLGNPDRDTLSIARDMASAGPSASLPPVHARFVIDILSGTSAGGINAVFLAKALANDQSLESLEKVWMTEGDIATLINDKGSLVNVAERLRLQASPTSLLNGQRMYLQLLAALDAMDAQNAKGATSPLVERLDLFCTATDLAGLRVRLPIADGVIEERRYRNVFHFQHPKQCSEDSNDFELSDNPFLAFAARCTSAFPFAFEPMTLSDIFPVLRTATAHANQPYCDPATGKWQNFYVDYAQDTELPFAGRAFGDGGYLDNKPFSYAIDTTLTRHAALPVDRKLIYIEPKPEGLRPAPSARPDALQNSLDALTVLPREETIREDLDRVLRRNTEVARVNRVLKSVFAATEQRARAPSSGAEPTAWLNLSNEDATRIYGSGYSAYQRLKLSEVTDQLSDLVASTFRIDAADAHRGAIRVLLGTWRENEIGSNRQQRKFLLDFDVGYRLRRLRHVGLRIKALDEDAATKPELSGDEVRRDYRNKLREIKRGLGVPHRALRRVLECGCELELPAHEVVPLAELDFVLGTAVNLPDHHLTPEEQRNDDTGAKARSQRVLAERKEQIASLEKALATALQKVFGNASRAARSSFAVSADARKGIQLACADVAAIYDDFEAYDSIFFPINFGTDTGEGQVIDIHRISPNDAHARSSDVTISGGKLKGQALGSFGAFLDKTWRHNDILWGRLDGAERLIEIVLPGLDAATRALQSALIDEAQEEIVREFLAQHELPWLSKQAPGLVNNWRALLGEYLTTQVRPEPEPVLAARAATRSAAVTGQILEGIFEKPAWAKRPFSWLATLGNLGWALVEIAVPHSIWELFAGYWIQLLLAASLIVFGAGLLVSWANSASAAGTTEIGGAMMAAALLLYCLRAGLRRHFRGTDIMPNWLRFGLGVGMCLGLGVGVLWLSEKLEAPALLWLSVRHPTLSVPRAAWAALGALDVAAALVVCVLGTWLAMQAAKLEPAASGATNPARDLQFARTDADLRRAVTQRDLDTRQKIMALVHGDYAFIGSYLTLMLAVGLTVTLSKGLIGLTICAAGLITAGADLTENGRMLSILAAPATQLSSQRKPFVPAVVKWSFAALALVLLIAALAFF
jgi:patatin-related protein